MNIFILTGTGISAESGLGTFRDMGGLWSAYDLNDVATPESFAPRGDETFRPLPRLRLGGNPAGRGMVWRISPFFGPPFHSEVQHPMWVNPG